MTEKEKLIELLDEVHKKPLGKEYRERLGNIADHLIANGVTFREDAHWATEQAYKNGYEDGKKDAVKWISVKDRLPQQGQEVIVYSGGVLKPTVFAYQFWNKNYDNWARITHWMPLPEPPKGE